MSVDLAGAVAVITAAGSGIGRATALTFAARGARVVVTDVREDRAAAVADEITSGGQGAAVAARCDVTHLDDLQAARDLAVDTFGRVDVVMNNAGVVVSGPVEEIPLEAWERTIDVNLLGVVRSNLVFLPGLIEQGSGHVVNTSSTSGILPYGFELLPYTATKYGVVGLSEALWVYLRPRGIGVTCFCPAGVNTKIHQQVTHYGDTPYPLGPDYPFTPVERCGELVADAVEQDRFLVVTAPGVADDLRRLGADVDAYLRATLEQYG
jgi:NAD(P)-dependent dehydrogenase (short-subunit alcohol dehydrogenase family)